MTVEKVGRLQQTAHVRAQHEVLTDVYRKFHARLRAHVGRHTRAAHDAEDLTQEVYLRLTRMSSDTAVRSPQAFAFRIATNLLRDRSRRVYTRMMRESVALENLELADGCADPSRIVESQQVLAAVAHAVADLKPSTRRAFLSHRFDAKSHREIAAEMGISTSMVEKHVSTALAALRTRGLSAD